MSTKKEDKALFRFLFFQELSRGSFSLIPCNSFVLVSLSGFNLSNYLLKILKFIKSQIPFDIKS